MSRVGAVQCSANTQSSSRANPDLLCGDRSRVRLSPASSAASAAVCSVGSMVVVILGFNASVQRYHTAGHIVVFTLAETSVFHHILKRTLVGVFTDGFCEVLVAFAVIGH